MKNYPKALDTPGPSTWGQLLRKYEMEENPVTRWALRTAMSTRIDRAQPRKEIEK